MTRPRHLPSILCPVSWYLLIDSACSELNLVPLSLQDLEHFVHIPFQMPEQTTMLHRMGQGQQGRRAAATYMQGVPPTCEYRAIGTE
jgi:5-keto 4-deoxyuronate isomerase